MLTNLRFYLVNRWMQPALLVLLSLTFPVSAESFIDPVKNCCYRSGENRLVFGSNIDDKFRIPSMEQLNNGDIVFFAEERLESLSINDFKRQNIIMSILKKDTGTITSYQQILLSKDAANAEKDGLRYKHNLMNPVSVYNRVTGVLHLFYNHIVSYGISDTVLNIEVMHTKSTDNGNTWSTPRDMSRVFGDRCEALIIGPGRGIQIPASEPYGGRILLPFHTRAFPGQEGTNYPIPAECQDSSVPGTLFKTAFTDDDGNSWKLSNRLSTDNPNGGFTENQIVYLKGTLHMFSRLSGDYEYDGTGLAYSIDGGNKWLKGFNAHGPKDYKSNNVAMTGRFVTPTQSGLATDGEYLYYTTSVFYSKNESLTNRRSGWTHRIDPDKMLSRDNSPVNIVQPITNSGFSNAVTLYLGDNKIGVTWEEVRIWKLINKRIRRIYFTVLDTRDFRNILDPAWIKNEFTYLPVWNGSHHLLNPEILGEDKTDDWDPR